MRESKDEKNSRSSIILAKKRSYSDIAIVQEYEARRFGGKSGKYVDSREKMAVKNLLRGVKGRVLDVACGTGRFTELLIQRGIDVISIDYSEEMLKLATKKMPGKFVRCDALALPFERGTFNGAVIGRLFQHYQDISPFLSEIKRVTNANGVIVFDTLRWSPRMLFFLFSKETTQGVFGHSNGEIRKALESLDLTLESHESLFLFAPGLYRVLPFWLVKLLDKLEGLIPDKLLVRTFWKTCNWDRCL